MELLHNNYLKKTKTLITLSMKAVSLGNRLHRKGSGGGLLLKVLFPRTDWRLHLLKGEKFNSS